MRFASHDDASEYAGRPCPNVRLIGRCALCGRDTAVTVPGRWVLTADLLGGGSLDVEPAATPIVAACPHPGDVAWRSVTVQPGGEPCGVPCRSATGTACRCVCRGTNHGAHHHPR